MKKTTLLIVLFQVSIGFSQSRPPGQLGPQAVNNQRLEKQEMPTIETSKLAGIIEYDKKKVFKNLNLKKTDTIAASVLEPINAYNGQIKMLSNTNKDLFEGLDVVINQNIQAAIKNQDRNALRSTMDLAREKIKSVKSQVAKQEATLNSALKGVLDDDQYKKWMSYQKGEKKKLMPRRKKPINPRDKPKTRSNARVNQRIGR